MSMLRAAARLASLAMAMGLTGCREDQSVLAPKSRDAEVVANLTELLLVGGTFILALVLALTGVAILGSARTRGLLASRSAILVGGLLFPVVTLTSLLVYGYAVLGAGPSIRGPGSPLDIGVVGERWWWRVVYTGPDGRRFESANELRIPVGRTVRLTLNSADVIHSFWVPNLAGKVDMIPGRANVLHVTADHAGEFRGQCAEYCGGAHALMAFKVIALEPDAFAQWLRRESAPATTPASPSERRGGELFLANGCGGCHQVRGTQARGLSGPDLTHVGSRSTLAAATLANGPEQLAHWIRDNQAIKPDNLMVPYLHLAPADLDAISLYLAGLR